MRGVPPLWQKIRGLTLNTRKKAKTGNHSGNRIKILIIRRQIITYLAYGNNHGFLQLER